MTNFFNKVSIATLLMLAGMPLYSGTIDVLAQSYSISGAAWTSEPDPNRPGFPIILPFSSSGTSPVYLTDIYPSLTGWFLNAYAIGTADASTVFLKASIGARVTGQSVAQVTFRPAESGMLDLTTQSTDGGADAYWNWLLVDVTTGNTLLSRGSRGLVSSLDSDSIAVDSSHEYTLTDNALGFLGDGASVGTTLTMSSVPEVCSTMLLLVMTLASVVGLKKLS